MTLKEVADNHGLTPEGVDYALRQYQIVISEITHGFLSKLSYDAHDVLRCAQERWCDTCELKAQEIPDTNAGKWTTERTQEHDGEWYCSECGYEPVVMSDDMKYCPGCGRKMTMPEPQKEET